MKRGFSLTELLVVLFILGLGAVFAAEPLAEFQRRQELSAAAARLSTAIERTKTTVRRTSESGRFTFNVANRSYTASVGSRTIESGVLPANLTVAAVGGESTGAVVLDIAAPHGIVTDADQVPVAIRLTRGARTRTVAVLGIPAKVVTRDD